MHMPAEAGGSAADGWPQHTIPELPSRLHPLACLGVQAAELPGLVEQLLVAVKGTNDFEAELAHQFSGQAPDAPPEVQSQLCVRPWIPAICPGLVAPLSLQM